MKPRTRPPRPGRVYDWSAERKKRGLPPPPLPRRDIEVDQLRMELNRLTRDFVSALDIIEAMREEIASLRRLGH